jgi:branched-chain amino acid transport system ATP-binding protein
MFNTRSKTTNVIQVLGQKFQPGDWINPAQFGQRLFYKMFGGTHLVNRAGLAAPFKISGYFARCRWWKTCWSRSICG